MATPAPRPPTAAGARLWLGYAGVALSCLALYAVAGIDWLRGTRTAWDGLYDAVGNLGTPVLLGPLVWPWVRWVRQQRLSRQPLLHGLGALGFVLAWMEVDGAVSLLFFGLAHAQASFVQGLPWRLAVGVFVYGALSVGFGSVLHARQAQAAALQAAQAERDAAQAQAALVRSELAVIQGKLNPHFLFNTLNSLLMLTRRDPAAAEHALLTFSRLMRYVLDRTREPDARVPLRDELAFVREYLALEQLRLGERLRVTWAIDPAAEQAGVPPLTLQPLVENAVAHGIAPRVQGGTVSLQASVKQGLLTLEVRDDGAGGTWPLPEGARRGVGLEALQRRLALEPGGRAQLAVQTAPGAGFAVTLTLPQDEE